MSNDTPLLTLSQVREWEARCAELRILLAKHTEELDLLTRKIDAARMFIELLPLEMASSPGEENNLTMEGLVPEGKADESISAVVLAAVSALRVSSKANEIRDWITKNHPSVSEKLDANPAYLYTSLMRHVRGGRLAKRGRNYRLPKSLPTKLTDVPSSEVQGEE